MNFFNLAWILISICGAVQAQSPQNMEMLYIGSYSNRGAGIYVYAFDRPTLAVKEIQVMPNENSPSFLAFHPNKRFMYSANEGNNTIGSYAIDASSGKLSDMNEVSSQGDGPCHISIDPAGKLLFVSNYGGGSLAVYHIQADGQIGSLADQIQNKGAGEQKAHMHSMIPSADGRFVYASDLGLDQIVAYEINQKTGKLQATSESVTTVTKGDGPRHLTIHPNGRFAYSAGELHSVVNVFEVDTKNGQLSAIQRIDMLPANSNDKSFAADIHISSDGKFLYASNRGHESIVIYSVDPKNGRLTLSNHVGTQGKHPRNFMIDSEGSFAIVANRDDDNLVFFERNKADGNLKYSGQQIRVPAAVFVDLLLIN